MLKVFISYTKTDHEKVAPLFHKIKELGFDPWLDSEKLLPGHNWSREIDQALAEANVVMLLISESSVNKRGFVQREANEALENLKSRLPTDIYIIPVLLEPCEVPAHIADRLQFIDINKPDAWTKITKSLELAADEQKIIGEQGAEHGPFRVFEKNLSEEGSGNPGYSVQISYPRFTSDTFPDAAASLSAFFAGRAEKALIENRTKPWDQGDEEISFASDNGRWDSYSISFSNQQFLSVSYTVGWYGAGAAHPNSHFECYNYIVVDSKIYPISLQDFFEDWQTASPSIVQICSKEIQKEYWDRTDSFPDETAQAWIASGIGKAETDNFLITDLGFTILYSPYEVAAYAFGSFSAHVPFDRITGGIRPVYAKAISKSPQ